VHAIEQGFPQLAPLAAGAGNFFQQFELRIVGGTDLLD